MAKRDSRQIDGTSDKPSQQNPAALHIHPRKLATALLWARRNVFGTGLAAAAFIYLFHANITGSLVVMAPGNGDAWAIGSQHFIHWTTSKLGANLVRIEYSHDGGLTWKRIDEFLTTKDQYLWRIRENATSNARLRVTVNEKSAESSGRFQIVPSQELQGCHWVRLTSEAPFAPRDGAGALAFKGKMWLIGGWNPLDKVNFPRICSNDVWSSVDGAVWSPEKPNSFLNSSFNSAGDWEGRHTAGYVVFKDQMWIIGGDVVQGHYQNDVWKSADGATWQLVTGNTPWGPRALQYTVVFRNKIWVMGGQTLPNFSPAPDSLFNDIWTTEDGIKWRQEKRQTSIWQARGMIGGRVVFKDRIWILGGGTYDTPGNPTRSYYNDVWSSSDGVNWIQNVGSAPWGPRQYHCVATYLGRIWVLGGSSPVVGNRNDVWYSTDGSNWYELPDTPWSPRHAASVLVHDGSLWIIGGNDLDLKSDVWRLIAARDSTRPASN